MKRMIIKILQIFLKKYKNTKRLKSLAKPKGSSKLELKNLRKIWWRKLMWREKKKDRNYFNIMLIKNNLKIPQIV